MTKVITKRILLDMLDLLRLGVWVLRTVFNSISWSEKCTLQEFYRFPPQHDAHPHGREKCGYPKKKKVGRGLTPQV